MKHAALSAILLSLVASSALAADACHAIFASPAESAVTDLRARATRVEYKSPNTNAYRALKLLYRRFPAFREGQNARIAANLERVLANEELSVPALLAEKVLRATEEKLRPSASETELRETLKSFLETELAKQLPLSEAQGRARTLDDAGLTREKMLYALGDLSVAQSYDALIGPGGPRHPSPDSLTGKFLARARELGVVSATLVGRFSKGPDKDGARGDERLFIAVDKRTHALAEEIFGQNPHNLIHEHTPQAGTQIAHHRGQNVSYSKYNGPQRMSVQSDFVNGAYVTDTVTRTIAPIISLSTLEASRATNYFDLGQLTNSARAKYPWSFSDGDSGETRYCRMGGYTSCTHWFGEMPIGGELTKEYAFPGQPDGYADQHDPDASDSRAIRAGAVGRYDHFMKHGRAEEVGNDSRVDRLTRLVWKEHAGHQQLWQMLGLRGELERGELANPGWTLYSLLGAAPAKRVPVVLMFVEDASVPLTPASLIEAEKSIHAL